MMIWPLMRAGCWDFPVCAIRDTFVNVDIDARTRAAGFLDFQDTAVFDDGARDGRRVLTKLF